MAEEGAAKTYRGNCHCGAFVFETKSPEIKSAMPCNCSICVKKGYLWFFPTEPVTIVKGDGSLTAYKFGPKTTTHLFCPTCGIAVMGQVGPQCAINARTFQDLDIWSLECKQYDGRSLNPEHAYVPPVYSGPEPSAEVEGGKIYTGSCHCGAVAAAVKTKPLDDSYSGLVRECNCSICQRGGYIWIYPTKDQLVVQGQENLSYYVFASGNWRKAFCKTCGVHIMNDLNPLTDEQIGALAEADQQMRAKLQGFRPFTLRVLNDFDLSSVKIEQNDFAKNLGPVYVNP